MKVILIGANGQLGSDIQKTFSHDSFYDLIPVKFPEIDITKAETIDNAVEKYKPDMIISTAAYHRVDECETHPEESFGVNAFGVRNLCLSCQNKNITLVHFSTDYVFGLEENRKTPYTENDAPGPISVYGISKLAGEYFARYMMNKYFLIRTSGLYGAAGPAGKGTNFADNMVKKAKDGTEVKVVQDQILTPTYTLDLAENLKELLKTESFGLYHITSEGQCSWYEFAREIFRLLNSHTVLTPVSTAEFYSPVARPSYSVLENSHLKQINLNVMKPWQNALKRYLEEKNYI